MLDVATCWRFTDMDINAAQAFSQVWISLDIKQREITDEANVGAQCSHNDVQKWTRFTRINLALKSN